MPSTPNLAQESQLPPSEVFPSFGNRFSGCLCFILLGGRGEEKSHLGLEGKRDVIPENKIHCPMLLEGVLSTMLSPIFPAHPTPLHREDAFAISLLAPKAGWIE